jgi:competence protein ComEC
MVEQVGARSRAATWRPGHGGTGFAAGRGPLLSWPVGFEDFARAAAQRAWGWAFSEVAPGRLVPWLAIAFGLGAVLYFTADQEPSPWAAATALVAASAAAVITRRRPVAFPLVLGLAMLTAGFAAGTFKRAMIAHPVLQFATSSVSIAGFIEARDERERSDRIVVRVSRIEGGRLDETQPLERVRLTVRKGTAPAVGSFIKLKARLSPPLEPLRPGGYDFGRDMYFQGIGASGFSLGAIETIQTSEQSGAWLAYATFLSRIRKAIDQRIRAVLPGDQGSIASALITGLNDPISTPVNNAMIVSSLVHVLSISGYHMAVIAGIVFFTIRALLALIPGFASRHPIKKWAAVAALVATTFYLLLSGSAVATQRSYIMIAIVLVGVMLDRPALTFRTLTAAALGVLLLAPEAVASPSFQMSFAATLALIAGYQHGLPWMRAGVDTPLGARIALWGVREIIGLMFASLLAGSATMIYIAYHFHQFQPYGLLANLLAMPVVSALVMPMGILGVLAMPFGFDDICWRLMGEGIDWMITVVLWVASLPGANTLVPSFGTGPLLLATAGLVVVCLLRTPLRLAGPAMLLVAIAWALRTPQPDVLVAPEGSAVAVRTAAGRLAIVKSGSDIFAMREWLAADADSRTPKDKGLDQGIACDQAGCIGRLADGALVAISRTTEAFEEDCRRAALVVSTRQAPAGCAAHRNIPVIDRKVWRLSGAVALRRVGGSFETIVARSPGYNRPWARAVPPSAPGLGAVRPVPANPVEEESPDDEPERGD